MTWQKVESNRLIPRKRQTSRISILRLLLAGVAGAGLFAWFVWYVSPRLIMETLAKVEVPLIIAAGVSTLLATVIRTLRFSIFISARGQFVKAYAVFSIARFLNLALPFRSGDIAMLAVLKRARLADSIAEVMPVWLVLRVSDALALALWFSVIAAFATVSREYAIVGVIGVCASLAIIFLMQYSDRMFPARLRTLEHVWIVERLLVLVDGFRHIKSLSKRIAAICLAMVIWACLIVSGVFAQFGFSSPVEWHAAALVSVFVFMFSLLPVNAPLDIGTGELLWTASMMLVGVPIEVAAPIAIGIRVIILAILIVEGAIGAMLLFWLLD